MTRICRFNDQRFGLVEAGVIYDVTPALDILPPVRWPVPPGDLLIANLDAVLARTLTLKERAPTFDATSVKFLSPVANPSKLIAAPVNYLKHQAEANADGGKNFDADVKTIDHYGLFLKSTSSLVGTGEAVGIAFPERRADHEIELAVVIGRGGRNISREQALGHVAGYALGLDLTLRGPEDRSLRKSLDGFSVLGPWLVTADEIDNPNALDLELSVNGQVRQKASTADLIFDVQRLIEYASSFYTLFPGDVIFTGTPEGVGPIVAGDVMTYSVQSVGHASTRVVSAL